VDVVFKCLRQRSNLKYVCQQYFKYGLFLLFNDFRLEIVAHIVHIEEVASGIFQKGIK
jgi:hypothetical protein